MTGKVGKQALSYFAGGKENLQDPLGRIFENTQ